MQARRWPQAAGPRGLGTQPWAAGLVRRARGRCSRRRGRWCVGPSWMPTSPHAHATHTSMSSRLNHARHPQGGEASVGVQALDVRSTSNHMHCARACHPSFVEHDSCSPSAWCCCLGAAPLPWYCFLKPYSCTHMLVAPVYMPRGSTVDKVGARPLLCIRLSADPEALRTSRLRRLSPASLRTAHAISRCRLAALRVPGYHANALLVGSRSNLGPATVMVIRWTFDSSWLQL